MPSTMSTRLKFVQVLATVIDELCFKKVGLQQKLCDCLELIKNTLLMKNTFHLKMHCEMGNYRM